MGVPSWIRTKCLLHHNALSTYGTQLGYCYIGSNLQFPYEIPFYAVIGLFFNSPCWVCWTGEAQGNMFLSHPCNIRLISSISYNKKEKISNNYNNKKLQPAIQPVEIKNQKLQSLVSQNPEKLLTNGYFEKSLNIV